VLGVLVRLLNDPLSRPGINRLIVRKLTWQRQRASVVKLLVDKQTRQRSLPRIGTDGRYVVPGRLIGAAYGLVFPKAVMASRRAVPVRVAPIAVGAPGGKITTLDGGEVKSSRSANP
jgi:hypothetical protein